MVGKKLNIIYEDKKLLVVNKPYNLLSIGTEKEKEKTLYHQVFEYIKRKNQKVYIVNRLDRETSGIVLFAKDEKLKRQLQDNWNDIVKRNYVAVVYGKCDKEKTIKAKLKENATFKTYVDPAGKEAITKYTLMKQNDNYSMININILTGRKNQIRVHMSYDNHPIVGDIKYGIEKKCKRMYLHASRLELIHPITHKTMVFESKPSRDFGLLFK